MSAPSTITVCTEKFGLILNCAVRYAMPRETYVPSAVIDFIAPLILELDDRTISCMARDIEEAQKTCIRNPDSRALGDPRTDTPGWLEFLDKLKQECERRGLE